MNKPTIGRIVMYRDTNGVVLPAVIVYVAMPDDVNSWVNVRVFSNTTGELPWVTSLPKNQNTDEQTNYSWEWPTLGVVTAAPVATETASATASI
jgi:hypothetical protein